RTDIFAFGALVHEMTTGRPVFDGSSKASVIAAILERQPLAVTMARSQEGSSARGSGEQLPPQMDLVVGRCLAKDPNERWQTASDLKQTLQWIAEGRMPAVA